MSKTNMPGSCFLMVHAVPKSVLSRLESELSALIHAQGAWEWLKSPNLAFTVDFNSQVSEPMLSGSMAFNANLDTVSQIASRLAALRTIWFEVAIEYSMHGLGQRYCYTPLLGIFHSQLDEVGNQVFGENQLKSLTENHRGSSLQQKLREVLGVEWDSQLEPLRKANYEVRYLTDLAS